MSPHVKEWNKKMPTPRQEVQPHPFDSSLFLSDMHCFILCRYSTYNLRTNGNTFELNLQAIENKDVTMQPSMISCPGVGIFLFPFFYMR